MENFCIKNDWKCRSLENQERYLRIFGGYGRTSALAPGDYAQARQ
jgi:hypothetical protein